MTTTSGIRRNRRTTGWAAALVAVALAASACGGTDDDSADSGFDPGEAESTVAANDRSVDAESDFVAAESEGVAEEAMEEEAMEESSDAMVDDGDAERGFAPEAAEETAGEGFFDEEPEEIEPEEDPAENTTFENAGVRPFVDTDVDPLSTFALDVDTASYSIARNTVAAGGWPDADGIRVEEFVNAFSYDYSSPRDGLGVTAEGGPSPLLSLIHI